MNKITNLKGISRSTLYEELKRGTVTQKNSDLTTRKEYFAETGQIVYEKNRQNCRKPLKILSKLPKQKSLWANTGVS